MTERFPLDAAERTALRDHPPTDQAGRRIPWVLRDRFAGDEEWEDGAFEQEGLTFERVAFERIGWTAAGVFRRCVLRDVSFTDCTLSGLRFEDVTFEGCQLAGLALERCAFTRCTFTGGRLGGLSALHCQFTECTWSAVEAPGWTFDDCELLRCLIENTRLSALRASGCTMNCQLLGGTLLSADLSECKGDMVDIGRTEMRGVRGLGLKLGRLSLSGLIAGEVSLGQCTVGALSLRGCDELTTLSLVACTVGILTVEACPSLQGVMVRASKLDAMSIVGSMLGDTTFEDVDAPGDSRITGSTLRGLFFNGGVWARLTLSDVELADYLAIEKTRFVVLSKHQVREPEPVRRRLEGDEYGPGSGTWRTSDGA